MPCNLKPLPSGGHTANLTDTITAAIQAASNEELERGRKRTEEVRAALTATLETLAAVTTERDGLADELSKTHKLLNETQERYEAALEEKRAELAKVTQERDLLSAANGKLGAQLLEHSDQCILLGEQLAATLENLAKVARERDELRTALELIGDALLRVEINPNNYTHEEVCALNDAASTAFQLADQDCGPIALAAHERAVAARVLRRSRFRLNSTRGQNELLKIAAEYEAGEREVPGE